MSVSPRAADAVPDFSGDACQGFDESDRARLWDAANRLVNAHGLSMRLTSWLSRSVLGAASGVEAAGLRLFGTAWSGIESTIQNTVESVLWKAHDLATIGVGSRRQRDPRVRLHRLSASASGAMSGFAGLPGLLLDIPVTTGLMLRSIAGIARDHGEDLATQDAKRACLEVLAQGANWMDGRGAGEPRADGARADDAEAELGYWSARAGLSHLTISLLIRTAAARLGVTLSEKLLAQAVPVAGAVAGAGLNWVFMGYYQEMAHVHFTIRAVERRTGDQASVRACFDRLVEQARRTRRAAPPAFRPVAPTPKVVLVPGGE